MTAFIKLNYHNEFYVNQFNPHDIIRTVDFDDLIGIAPSEVSAGQTIRVQEPVAGLRGMAEVVTVDYSSRTLCVAVRWDNNGEVAS